MYPPLAVKINSNVEGSLVDASSERPGNNRWLKTARADVDAENYFSPSSFPPRVRSNKKGKFEQKVSNLS